jgi:molecular chaperone IbpA
MPSGFTQHKLAFKGATIMTGLTKFTTKDLNAIVDAVEKYSIGFDDLFYRLHSYGVGTPPNSYPPYNLVKIDEEYYRIELALAGWKKDEVEVSTQSGVLLIKSIDKKEESSGDYMHRGVAKRSFARGFNLHDNMKVDNVKFEDGMLTVTVQKILPDHQKLKTYSIE